MDRLKDKENGDEISYYRRLFQREQGFCKDHEAMQSYVDKMEELYREPGRMDLKWQLGIDEDLIDDSIRQVEFRNWLDFIRDENR